ncbi:MAG: hypothetical protein K2X81_07170 [Candidatus Obscuribacterales bacterium]|nr:hypothetical protein [Candidatus Obscuribacterales bacterium]
MDITEIGPFKRIVVPDEWKRTGIRVPQANRQELPVVKLVLPELEDKLEIGIFYRGRLESEADGENFRALLNQYKTVTEPASLGPGQIRSLQRILNLAGFNQYSFPRHMTGYSADFQLRTAQVLVINGRPVLRVDGEFKADQAADTFYECLYVEAGNKGRKIYELYLRAADRHNYMQALTVFRHMCTTIGWNQL